jgi:hypothetical protein
VTSELAPLLVVCLCADWCNVCTEYRSRFEQVQAAVTVDDPQARFVWIDIEDEADLLHPLDVENFPTLLIAVGHVPHFFGPLTPQAQTLERLVRNATQDVMAPGLQDPEVVSVVARIRAEKLAGR